MKKNKPILSFLIPSRGRFNYLCDAIISIVENSSDSNKIEILIKFDDDDFDSLSKLSKLPYKENIKIIIYSRGDGYGSLHHFQNDLYKISSGNWILSFSDDAIMKTKNYDLLFNNLPIDVPFAVMYSEGNNHAGDIFPGINRKYCEVQGDFFSASAYSDGHIWYTIKKLNNYTILPVTIFHIIEDVGKDNTLLDKEKFQRDGYVNPGDSWAVSTNDVHSSYEKIKNFFINKSIK